MPGKEVKGQAVAEAGAERFRHSKIPDTGSNNYKVIEAKRSFKVADLH